MHTGTEKTEIPEMTQNEEQRGGFRTQPEYNQMTTVGKD